MVTRKDTKRQERCQAPQGVEVALYLTVRSMMFVCLVAGYSREPLVAPQESSLPELAMGSTSCNQTTI